MVIEEHAALDVITKDGSTYAIDESQIIRGSLTTSQSCSSGGGIPAGSCNTGTASVAFHAPSALSYEKLFGAKVKLYVWYGDTSKKQVGVYNVTSTERSYGVYTLSLSDNVYLLDEACYSDDTTTDAQNWLAMQLGEKKVPSVIFNMICNAYSVPHWNAAKNEEAVPESGIGALSVKVPSDCCTESVKDFANYLAEYLGAIIMPDENGELHFAYMGSRTCPITIDASNIERDTYQKSPFHVSTSSWRVNHDSGIWTSWSVSGDFPENAAPLSIVVNNNPFWQSVEDGTPESMVRGRTETMLRYMWVAQGKVAYIDNVPQINPFRCTVHVPYYFRAGDRVKIIDPITSEVYHSYVTDVTWTFRGGQQISCAGEDTRTLSVSTSRNGAKKMSDYSRYLYRKSKSNTGSVEANTYTKAEIDAKDAAVKSAADKAQGTADGAVSVNNTQSTQIAALQKSAHTHSNKSILDKTEQPYTTAERDKLAGLENYTHPTYTEHKKGFYKFASDGEGHVTDAGKVTKKDITDLGIPGDDTNTTYRLALPTYASQKEPQAPILSLIGSDGSENKQTIPCAYTVLDDIVYKEFSGFKIGGKYRSVADLAFVIPRSARIYPWRITANISIETPSGNNYVDLHYTLEITDGGVSIRRYQGNGKYYSGNPCTTNDWAILSDLQNFYNPDRDVWLYRIGVPDDVFNKLTNAYCEARLVYQTGKNGDVVKPVSYYKDITFDENFHAMDTNLVYVLTKADVSDVAFTGSYNDLSDKPTIPDVSGKQDKSTAVTHSANTAAGSATKPVYVAANGVATPISHSINSDVPANAKFTDTTYIDATQSTHGLMTAADKKKLDGMDLTKYLPKSGGVMTGDIDMQTNKKDILVGTHKATTSGGTAVAGGTINTDKKFVDLLPTMRSYMGTYNYKTSSEDAWYDLISVRHRNGYGDGSGWGMIIYANLFGGNLQWNLNTNKDAWQGGRVLLDSVNYTSYAADKNHTHQYVPWIAMGSSGTKALYGIFASLPDTNPALSQGATLLVTDAGDFGSGQTGAWIVQISNRSNKPWMIITTLIPHAAGDVQFGYYHDTANKLFYFGVYTTPYRSTLVVSTLRSGAAVIKKFADYESTPSGWTVVNPMYDITKATTLTDSGWIATTRSTTFTATSAVKCRKYGQLVEVRGEVTFNSTYGSPTVCTLPAGYRPATVVQACGITPSGKQYMIKADTSGVISFGSDSGSTFVKGTTYRVDLTYLLG